MNISTSDALELRRQEYQKFNAGCFSVFIPFIFLLIMGCQEQKKTIEPPFKGSHLPLTTDGVDGLEGKRIVCV
jgi:hypothetical protein